MNYFQLFFMLIIREIWLIICLELILIILFFDLGILSQTFTIHRTAGQWKIYLFNSSVPLSPASQTLRHQPGSYCREHTSAHSQPPYSNQKPLISELKLITTKLHALTLIYSFYKLFPAFICAYNTRSLVNSLFGVNIYNSFFLSRYSITNIHHSYDSRAKGVYLFNSSVPLSPASQTLTHQPGIIANSTPLHIASSRTRTRNL